MLCRLSGIACRRKCKTCMRRWKKCLLIMAMSPCKWTMWCQRLRLPELSFPQAHHLLSRWMQDSQRNQHLDSKKMLKFSSKMPNNQRTSCQTFNRRNSSVAPSRWAKTFSLRLALQSVWMKPWQNVCAISSWFWTVSTSSLKIRPSFRRTNMKWRFLTWRSNTART